MSHDGGDGEFLGLARSTIRRYFAWQMRLKRHACLRTDISCEYWMMELKDTPEVTTVLWDLRHYLGSARLLWLKRARQMQFPDDDSLVAYFWRKYKNSEGLLSSAMTQSDMNVASDESWRFLGCMMQALLAKLLLIYAGSPQSINIIEKSQGSRGRDFKNQMRISDPFVCEDILNGYLIAYQCVDVSLCLDRISYESISA